MIVIFYFNKQIRDRITLGIKAERHDGQVSLLWSCHYCWTCPESHLEMGFRYCALVVTPYFWHQLRVHPIGNKASMNALQQSTETLPNLG